MTLLMQSLIRWSAVADQEELLVDWVTWNKEMEQADMGTTSFALPKQSRTSMELKYYIIAKFFCIK